jgi:hypothetical protein
MLEAESGCEPLAALSPSGLEDRPAGPVGHTVTESVVPFPAPYFWLEGSFHGGKHPGWKGWWTSQGYCLVVICVKARISRKKFSFGRQTRWQNSECFAR